VGTNAYLWRNVLAELAGGRPGEGAGERRCIALDLPVHGHTPPPPDGDATLAVLADTVAAFVEALELSDVDLVAHDTGGAVAQIFAARHPDRLRTFTLTDCDTQDNIPPPAFQPTVELAKAGALAPQVPALLENVEATRSVMFGSGYEHPDELDLDVVRAYITPFGAPEVARVFERCLASLEPGDLLAVEPLLRQLTVPTLVVWGTGDIFFDVKFAYWLRDTIPGVTEVVELEGAKLFFPDERADELVPLLRRHWSSVLVSRA
jgi:pimeloyl-ACP methyl ester carboxylesterase